MMECANSQVRNPRALGTTFWVKNNYECYEKLAVCFAMQKQQK